MNGMTDGLAGERRMSVALLRRFGIAGFLFFLVKGLLWVAAPLLLVQWGSGG